MRSEKTIQTEYFPIRKWGLVKIEINLCICFVVLSHGTHSSKHLLFYSLPQDLDGICITLQGLLWYCTVLWVMKSGKTKRVLRMQMLLDTQNYSPSAIEEISLFIEMDIDIQKSISMWFFFFLIGILWQSILSWRIIRMQLLLTFQWER